MLALAAADITRFFPPVVLTLLLAVVLALLLPVALPLPFIPPKSFIAARTLSNCCCAALTSFSHFASSCFNAAKISVNPPRISSHVQGSVLSFRTHSVDNLSISAGHLPPDDLELAHRADALVAEGTPLWSSPITQETWHARSVNQELRRKQDCRFVLAARLPTARTLLVPSLKCASGETNTARAKTQAVGS